LDRQGRRLQLLGLYESRRARRAEENVAELRTLQARRKADLDRVVEEYTLLIDHALHNGEVFTEKQFPRETPPPNFVFSGPEKIRLAARRRRLAEARKLDPVVRNAPKLAAQLQSVPKRPLEGLKS
jgi:hypothetical protein